MEYVKFRFYRVCIQCAGLLMRSSNAWRSYVSASGTLSLLAQREPEFLAWPTTEFVHQYPMHVQVGLNTKEPS